MQDEQRIRYAVERTQVARMPEQTLATFGLTTIDYFMLTEPVYSEIMDSEGETVVRQGKVIAEKPKIVTPYYLMNLFEGFEHGQEYAHFMMREYGPHEAGLLYRYRNEPSEMSIVSSPIQAVVENINRRIDDERNNLAAIIIGVDELWDVSLMKFIHDITYNSLRHNMMELGSRRLLGSGASGVPRFARASIEHLFAEAARDRSRVAELEIELRRWGLFAEYEDRFLDLFRKH